MSKKKTLNIVIMIPFLIGIIACVIVDFALERRLTWSLIVIGGCIVGYLVTAALVFGGKYRVIKMLLVVSILVIPYLYIIERVANYYEPTPIYWVTSFGVPVSLIWLLFIWLLVLIRKITHINVWLMTGIGILFFYFAEGETNSLVDQLVGKSESIRLSEVFPQIYFIAAGVFLIVGALVWILKGRNKRVVGE